MSSKSERLLKSAATAVRRSLVSIARRHLEPSIFTHATRLRLLVPLARVTGLCVGAFLAEKSILYIRSQLNYHKYDHVSPKDETVQARRHQPT